MNTAIFYDTETTGLPDWGQPSEAEQQPHIVQLGTHLVDMDSRKVLQSLDVIVKPDGWVIPEDVAEVHGITTERATAVGIPEALAVQLFLALWQGRRRIGHNESFDARIIRIATMRFADEETQDLWKEAAGGSACTARLTTKQVAAPPTPKMIAAGRRHHKTPNLSEAYRHFYGKDFDGAHSAIADVNACMAVYWASLDQSAVAF